MALHPCPGTLDRRTRNTPGPGATTGVLNEPIGKLHPVNNVKRHVRPVAKAA